MFAAIYIPNFSLQAALRHQADLRAKPVALVDAESSKAVLVEFNSMAQTFGVTAGLTASQAMARCGELTLQTRSLRQEEAASEILLQTAYAFSASVESTAPGVCTMGLKGLGLTSRPALEKWGAKILERLAPFYLTGRIGIAATPGLAGLAARTAKAVTLVEDAAEFISTRPLAALEPSPPMAEILQRWGVDTAGQFLALDKDKVAQRLGAEALELFGRVSADRVRPLKLISPPEHFTEQIKFEKEIETVEPLLFVLGRFVEQLSRRLEAVYLVVAEFRLQLGLSSGASHERLVHIPAPTGNVETLFRTLRTHLETVRTESPIVSLRLSATPSQAGAHQFGLFEAAVRNPNQWAETLARLGALCGSENVGRPVLEATHRPDAFRMKTPDFAARAELSCDRAQGLALRRFRPALSAQVEFCQERPSLLRCPMFSGTIAKTRGPFVYSGDWWEDGRWAREEWDVETFDGSLLRLVRSSSGCFVEGVYD